MQDAVVVGGGPAGSFFAHELAKQKFDVTVFEEHLKIGLPSHCTGHISIRSLRNLGLYPLPEGIEENTFSAANFYSPSGYKFSVRLSKPVTCAINRARFDQFLADKAKRSGVTYNLSTKVQSLIIEENMVKGINIIQNDGSETRVASKLVVDAEGVSSRLIRQVGLQTLKPEGLVYGVEAEMENIKDLEEHAVEVYLGENFAPGFFGWVVPRMDGSAKVGLATNRGNPKVFLERFIRNHPVASKQLGKARVKSINFHAVTLGGHIPRAYQHGFLAVGDCASQVKPTTGGGVIFGISCAKIAAAIASEALKNGDLSSNTLRFYQKRVNDKLGFDMKVMLKARQAINTFSDEKIDRAFRFATRIGFERALCDIDEIDFQGRALINLLWKPASYAAFVYLLSLYLIANA